MVNNLFILTEDCVIMKYEFFSIFMFLVGAWKLPFDWLCLFSYHSMVIWWECSWRWKVSSGDDILGIWVVNVYFEFI